MMATATMGPPLDPPDGPRRSGRAAAPSKPRMTPSSSNTTTPNNHQHSNQRGHSPSKSRSPELGDVASSGPPASSSSTSSRVRNGTANGHARQTSTVPVSNGTASVKRATKSANITVTTPEDDEGGPSTSSASVAQNGRGNGKRRGATKAQDKTGATLPPSSAPATSSTFTTTQNGNDNAADGGVPDDNAGAAEGEDDDSGATRCICGRHGEDDQPGEFWVKCEECGDWQHGRCMGYASEAEAEKITYFCDECRPDLHIDLVKKRKQRQKRATVSKRSVSNSSSHSHSPPPLSKPTKRRNTMNSMITEEPENIAPPPIDTTVSSTTTLSGESSSTAKESTPATQDEDSTVNGRVKRKRAADEDGRPVKRPRSASVVPENPTTGTTIREHTPSGSKTPIPAPPPSKASARTTKRVGGARKAGAAATQDQRGAGSEEPTPSLSSRKNASTRGKNISTTPRKPGPSALNIPEPTNRSGRGGSGAGTPISSISARQMYASVSQSYSSSSLSAAAAWSLPDHLSHLESTLPAEGAPGSAVISVDMDLPGVATPGGMGMGQGGNRVRWPQKRMSVADMNKRVRALVEWVGREQAGAAERTRRGEALRKVLGDEAAESSGDGETAKLMEELMEELIGFQEKFGSGRSRS